MDIKKIFKRKKTCRSNRIPLMGGAEDTDSSTMDCTGSAFIQNSINCKTEDVQDRHSHRGPQTRDQTRVQACPRSSLQSLHRESLCECLGVNLDCLSVCGHGSGQVSVVQAETLIQESVCTHLPQPPSELDTGLQRHLLAMQTVVQRELLRLAPLLEVHGLMGVLTQSYHRAVLRQMKELLPKTCSSRTCLQLLSWVVTQYISQELFIHPDLQTLDLVQYLDLVLLSDWIQDAVDKLISLLKTNVSSQLLRILDGERQHQPCRAEEDYISTYVDVIKCIDAAPTEACRFSPELSLKLTLVCLSELLKFIRSYKTQWFELLEMMKKKKMADQEMLLFFRTLKICKELNEYITKTKLKWTEVTDIIKEIEILLEETETFTLAVLLDTVAAFTETGLKKYFKSNHRDCFLMTDLERLFRAEPWLSLAEHKSTMDRCYRLIVSLYTKHLTSRSLHRLEQSWSPNVGVSVSVFEDAELLHKIMTNLCPTVEEWNFTLHYISDLLETKELDSIKLSAASMLHKCKENLLTEDMVLLPALLQWKGMSKWKINEVLDSLRDLEPDLVLSRPWYRSCFG